jgi:tetratricopeptide (TPR) repeat protein
MAVTAAYALGLVMTAPAVFPRPTVTARSGAAWMLAKPRPAATGGRGGSGNAPPPAADRRSKQRRAGGASGPSSAAPRDEESGLASLVRSQHEDNCATATALYGVPSDEPNALSYTGSWQEWLLPADTVSPGNAPYGTDALLRLSTSPLLSESEARLLTSMAEAHGAASGWDSRYPIDGYTHEVNVRDVPEARAMLGPLLRDRLLPAAAAAFPAFPASSLRVYDALIVQYNAATGHNCLPVHQDFALLTLNIGLSASSEYTGGGTWFQHSGQVLPTERGYGLLHAGRLPHCGVPVGSGVRSQLVLFLISTQHVDPAGRLKAVGAAAGAKAVSPGAASHAVDEPLSTRALLLSAAANPRDAEVWAQLGHNARARGDAKAAAEHFAKVVELSGQRDFAALCNLGWEQQASGQHEAALRSLGMALQVGAPPGPSSAALELSAKHAAAVALVGLNRHEDAGLLLEQVVAEDDRRAESWAALGLCMAAMGEEQAAMVCQKRVIALAAQQGR